MDEKRAHQALAFNENASQLFSVVVVLVLQLQLRGNYKWEWELTKYTHKRTHNEKSKQLGVSKDGLSSVVLYLT